MVKFHTGEPVVMKAEPYKNCKGYISQVQDNGDYLVSFYEGDLDMKITCKEGDLVAWEESLLCARYDIAILLLQKAIEVVKMHRDYHGTPYHFQGSNNCDAMQEAIEALQRAFCGY